MDSLWPIVELRGALKMSDYQDISPIPVSADFNLKFVQNFCRIYRGTWPLIKDC